MAYRATISLFSSRCTLSPVTSTPEVTPLNPSTLFKPKLHEAGVAQKRLVVRQQLLLQQLLLAVLTTQLLKLSLVIISPLMLPQLFLRLTGPPVRLLCFHLHSEYKGVHMVAGSAGRHSQHNEQNPENLRDRHSKRSTWQRTTSLASR